MIRKLKSKIEYFNEYSTLKVFKHVTTTTGTHFLHRLFWQIIFLCCFYGAVTILRDSLSTYFQDAVSYSVETDYLKWNTPFPGVTLCELYDGDKIERFLQENNLPKTLAPFLQETMYYNYTCQSCNKCKLNITCLNDIESLLSLVRASCEELLTDCWWNEEWFPCCDRFKSIETEYGQCFTFNFQLKGNDRELLYISREEILPVLTFVTQQHTLVKIHSPQNIVAAARGTSTAPCGSLSNPGNFEIILMAEQTITDDTVHSISQYSRDCLFKDELPDDAVHWPFEQYTYDSCLWYCKALAQAQLCKCTHHFMPRLEFGNETVPVCNLIQLKCLYKNRDLLANLNCDCPMDCDEIEYHVVHTFCSSSSENERVKGTTGVVRVGQLPSLRIRRHPIRDILGLFVDFGGVISAFFGASLLSFLEIIYIFLIR